MREQDMEFNAIADEELRQMCYEAQEGDKIAQHILGVCYCVGQGVKQDYSKAKKWIKLSMSQEVSDKIKTNVFIRCNKDNSPNANGEYILFGSYPQTIKSSSVSVDESTTQTQGTLTYYKGSDNEWYAKVVADPSGSGYKFSNNSSVTEGEIYYFKVEQVRWRILTENYTDGNGTATGNALILCDSIIQNMAYDDGENNNYANSDVRSWLNDQFYNIAFTELQKEIIQTTNVDNSAYSTGYSSNSYACSNTDDKIFLPSYREIVNSGYGFSSSYSTYDTARRMTTSDYSRATGAYTSTSAEYNGNGFWWLRSPYSNYSSYARYVNYYGIVSYYDGNVSDTNLGVVPALVISLS